MDKHMDHEWFWRLVCDLPPGVKVWGFREYGLVLWCGDCRVWIEA